MKTLFLAMLVSVSFAQVNLQSALILKMQKINKVATPNELQNYLELVREASKLKQTDELIYETLRIAQLTFNTDPHKTSVLILTDVYIENKKTFKKVFKKFDFKTATEFLESFDASERELIQGNG